MKLLSLFDTGNKIAILLLILCEVFTPSVVPFFYTERLLIIWSLVAEWWLTALSGAPLTLIVINQEELVLPQVVGYRPVTW